jgi:hypothetical protein
MRIGGWRSKHQVHGAAGDSVKCLAVLTGLLEDRALREYPKKRDDSDRFIAFFLRLGCRELVGGNTSSLRGLVR